MIDQLTARYEAEKKRIEENRSLAWSSMELVETFGEIEMKPMSVRAWVDLRASGNSFIVGGETSFDGIFAYVWRNCGKYTTKRGLLSVWHKWRLERKLKKTDLLDCLNAIDSHLQQAFDEVPETSSDGGYSRSSAIPGVDSITSAIDEVAARYGRDPESVLDWPISRLFGLQKAMRAATIPNYKPLAPKSIRDISGKILEAING